MTRRFLPLALVLLCLPAAPRGHAAQGQPVERPPATLYANALAKEKAVRAAFATTVGAAAVVKALRTVVADYEDLVLRHPTSEHCDDALWNAGVLSSDAFKKYGDELERSAAIRLLLRLASEYPTSKLAPKAPQLIATMQSAVARGAVTAAARAKPPAASAKPSRVATISAINRVALPDAVRVTIELDGEVRFHDERLSNPDRVFVDLFSTKLGPPLADGTLRFDGDTHPVRQVRIGRHPENVTRVVLEAAGVSTCSVYPLYGPYRLVVECIPETRPPVVSVFPVRIPVEEPVLLAADPFDPGWSQGLPGIEARPHTILAEPLASKSFNPGWGRALPASPPMQAVISDPPVDAPDSPKTPDANLAGGFSVARQLGLSVSRIVIDPGHGGHDPGARGTGLTEAEVVLDIALRLEKIFETVPDVKVILTRRTDVYVSLEERTAVANRENADLFLSIHANGSRNTKAGGVETYFLNFATNQDAAAVAARENATSAQSMSTLPDVVKAIALNNKLDESRDFATIVQRELLTQLRPANKELKDLGVKQAPFVVLIGAAMPSVLAEVSFVTNLQEARLLRGASYRQRVAQALFAATRRYQASLKSAAVAQG
jgi:N-acetylmuramoyl-L-alanine amidase